MIEQHVDHRRKQHRVSDAMVLDGLQYSLRFEARHETMTSAHQRDHVDKSRVCEVKHGSGVQIPSARKKPRRRAEPVQSVRIDVAMSEHGPLRAAGGATGVEETGDV